MAKNKHIKETDPLKVVYTPVRIYHPDLLAARH